MEVLYGEKKKPFSTNDVKKRWTGHICVEIVMAARPQVPRNNVADQRPGETQLTMDL